MKKKTHSTTVENYLKNAFLLHWRLVSPGRYNGFILSREHLILRTNCIKKSTRATFVLPLLSYFYIYACLVLLTYFPCRHAFLLLHLCMLTYFPYAHAFLLLHLRMLTYFPCTHAYLLSPELMLAYFPVHMLAYFSLYAYLLTLYACLLTFACTPAYLISPVRILSITVHQ